MTAYGWTFVLMGLWFLSYWIVLALQRERTGDNWKGEATFTVVYCGIFVVAFLLYMTFVVGDCGSCPFLEP